MQNAEAVLAVLRERGRKGLPCDELYRQMFNKSLYLLAYGRIYSNQGAMTPGACDETADGMSEGKIEEIIAAMRGERYRFAPVRRAYIPKNNGKLRAAGLAIMVGQARRRSGTTPAGSLLRADVFWPFTRFPERAGLSHRAAEGAGNLDRYRVVHRG
jgi:hypothetical protein